MNTAAFLAANRRILIVDDNPAIHDDFRKILSPASPANAEIDDLKAALFDEAPAAAADAGFELVSAFQGQEALKLLKDSLAEDRPFALAFLDVRMPPGWDGIETAARLWQAYPHLQIVICTAYSDYSWDEMRARLDQPDSLVILKKPFDNVEVLQLAHAMTKKWLLSRQARLRLSEMENMVAERTDELQKANESLRVSEERFTKAFHGSPVPSAILSLPEKRFVAVNETLSELVGRTPADLLGVSATEMGIWDTPDEVTVWFTRLLLLQDVREQQTKIRTQGGDLRDVLVSLGAVTLGGQPHALLLLQDISERLALEQQLRQAQKMEAIGQLAAGVAHDFNNILTVIQGYAGLLGSQIVPADPKTKLVDHITKASGRAATLIRQLLMFSRKQMMQFRNLDLNQTLGNAVPMLQRLVGEHIRLEFDHEESLPPVHADETMVEQIVMNLAVNARDAMPKGGKVKLSTSVSAIDRAATPIDPEPRLGNFVCLTFSDTGCGMDASILGRLFEPFFSTKAVGKGTGLGLATVFGIVRQHEGWIEVESKPGQGTTFRIYFPPSKRPVDKLAAIIDGPVRQGRETVLLAEDEDALREMVAQVLTVQGYTVLTAASGRQALKVWEEANRPIDLLVTDMVMPEGIMGGELAERLQAVNPALKVIYTSGYSPGVAGKDVSLLQDRNFLPKPYSIGKLANFVRQCLDVPPQKN